MVVFIEKSQRLVHVDFVPIELIFHFLKDWGALIDKFGEWVEFFAAQHLVEYNWLTKKGFLSTLNVIVINLSLQIHKITLPPPTNEQTKTNHLPPPHSNNPRQHRLHVRKRFQTSQQPPKAHPLQHPLLPDHWSDHNDQGQPVVAFLVC